MLGVGFNFYTPARSVAKREVILIDASGPRANINFSRASIASAYTDGGGLAFYAVDTPRIEYDPVSGTFLGTLVEPAATNLVAHSRPSQATWEQNGGSAIPQNLNALNIFPGVLEASAGSAYQRLNHPTIMLAAQTTYSVSLWLRPATSSKMRLAFRTGSGSQTNWGGAISALGPLSQGASGTILGYDQATLLDETIVLRVLFTPNQSTNYSIGVGPFSDTSGDSITVLGLQVEAGNQPSSFVLTTGTTETRAADSFGITGLTGPHDITITYDDNSVDVIASAPITEGYWPTLSRRHIQTMIAAPIQA